MLLMDSFEKLLVEEFLIKVMENGEGICYKAYLYKLHL